MTKIIMAHIEIGVERKYETRNGKHTVRISDYIDNFHRLDNGKFVGKVNTIVWESTLRPNIT